MPRSLGVDGGRLMGDLTVVVPTRGRPEAMERLADTFRDTCTADTLLVFALDDDDPTPEVWRHNVRSMRCESATFVEALNYATSHHELYAPFAIGFMGDDHCPRTVGWDAIYLQHLREMRTGMVFGNDLLQGSRLPTQIAMTSNIIRALGYMSPPTLRHMYVDNFWLDLGRVTGCLRYLPDVVVEHRHPTAGKAKWDVGYRRVNAPEVYSADETAYAAYQRGGAFSRDVDKVRMLLPPQEWRLFDDAVPFVSTFEFHEHRDRAPHLEQPEHRSRILAAAELVKTAAATLDSPTVSDLGCGDGGLLSLLELEAWGYDFAPANAPGWAERGVKAQALDVFGVDQDRVTFGDIAVATEVLEHIADPHGALRWIRDNARFIVASSPRNETASHHVPEHAWAWNEAGFAAMFRDAGWTIFRHEVDGASQLILAER